MRSYQGFYGRKPLLRNLLQFFGGAEKHRSKGDLTDIRHSNSPKLLRTTVSKALWKGKEKKWFPRGHGQDKTGTDYQKNVTSILGLVLVSILINILFERVGR